MRSPEWYPHHAGIRCTSYFPSFNLWNSTSIHKQKCLWGNCGSQHHALRDLVRVSPTCVLIKADKSLHGFWNWQDPVNCLQMLSASIWKYLENTNLGRYSQTREPLHNSRFLEKFQHSTVAKKKKKKNEVRHNGVGKRIFATSSLHLGSTA